MTDRSGHSPSHDELRDDLAAYALGALDEGESERLRAHLETCEGCRRQLRWLEPAIELLPRTVEQLVPPPRLRDSILDAVQAESPPAAREPPRPAVAGRWRSLGISLWRPATAAVAAAMLVVGVVAGYLIHEPGGHQHVDAAGAGDARSPAGQRGPRARRRLRNPPRGGNALAGARSGLRGVGPARRKARALEPLRSSPKPQRGRRRAGPAERR